MYDSLKDKQVDDNIEKLEKKLTSCCGSEQGLNKGEWVCFCCGTTYNIFKK